MVQVILESRRQRAEVLCRYDQPTLEVECFRDMRSEAKDKTKELVHTNVTHYVQ